jgi:pimeloyl-ACP methyl ester carboxylesterase
MVCVNCEIMAVFNHKSNLVTVSGTVKLYYQIHGSPGLPWVVLLNGLLSDSTMWSGLIHDLVPFCRVLTFDSRGQGGSDAPIDGPYMVHLLAQDAWELLRALDIQSPWLVGLSNGSSVGLELLAAHPDAFRGAMLASAVPFVNFSMQLRLRHWLCCLDLGGIQMQFDAAAPYIWSDHFLEKKFNILKKYYLFGQKYTNNTLFDLRYQIEGALFWDIRSRLCDIECPVSIIMGDMDLLTPACMGLDLARLIKCSEFEVIKGASHAFPVEFPSMFAKKIYNFIMN